VIALAYSLNHFRVRAGEKALLYDDRQQPKGIGIYPSREEADAALERVRDQPGFRDWPDGFRIFTVMLDRDHGMVAADAPLTDVVGIARGAALFELYHYAIDGDDDWVWEETGTWIGLYTSRDRAEAAIERLRSEGDFARFPDGFRIFEKRVGQEEWLSGFVSDEDC
jgi:hypothetical protein